MWHNVKEDPPAEGQAVVIKNEGIAVYCDGGFYRLELDPVLGILRKNFVPAVYWTNYIPEDE